MHKSPRGRWMLTAVLLAWLAPSLASAQDTPQAAPEAGLPPPAQTESVHPCARYGVSTVFRCILVDLREVAHGDSLRWAAGGGVLAAASILLDDEVLKGMWDDRQDNLVDIGEHVGEAGLHFAVPAAMYFISRATGHRDMADFSVMMVRTQTVNAALTRGLKLVPRPRPYQEKATLTKGSFPSGHTSAAFTSATVISRKWGRKAGIPAFLVATFVGTTRLQNLHYLSDVTFGAAVGIASGFAVKLPGQRTTVSPLVAPGTAGVVVSLAGAP